jgi:hypothetical protein
MNMSTHQYNWPSRDLRNIKTDVDWLYKCCLPRTQLIQKLVNMRCSRFGLRILFRLHVTIFNAYICIYMYMRTHFCWWLSQPQHHSAAGGIRQLDNLFFLSFFSDSPSISYSFSSLSPLPIFPLLIPALFVLFYLFCSSFRLMPYFSFTSIFWTPEWNTQSQNA